LHVFSISLPGTGEWSAFYISHFSYRKTTYNAHFLGDRVCTRSSLNAVDERKISTSAQELTPVPEYFGQLPCVYTE